VVIGAGWQHDAAQLNRENTKLMRRAFHRTALHAVRDQAAVDNLAKLGLRVVNASCPTLWALDAAATARIPATRAPEAVVTVTACRNRPAEDAAFLRLVTIERSPSQKTQRYSRKGNGAAAGPVAGAGPAGCAAAARALYSSPR